MYDGENFGRNRQRVEESEGRENPGVEVSTSEYARQRIKETRDLDATQKDILEQLSSGITKKEAAEYLALTRGLVSQEGKIHTEKVMPEIEALIKMAKAEGMKFE